MPRAPRYYVDGAFYHVYARASRGEHIFADEEEAARFVDVLHEVKRRDGLTIFAWCVMANHYHLALRTSAVPLWRSMRLIQWRFAREYNQRRQQRGPVWQDRYQVKMIIEPRHHFQVIAYIHLNPVVAGVVEDPARYRWSGHRELLRAGEGALVDVDATLLLFGRLRSQARRAYAQSVQGQQQQPWIREEFGKTPWWRGGREELDEGSWANTSRPALAHAVKRRNDGEVADWVDRAAAALEIAVEALGSPRKTRAIVQAREAIAAVGVEHHDIGVGQLARTLNVPPSTVSRWLTRAAFRRRQDPSFGARCDELERLLARQEKARLRQ